MHKSRALDLKPWLDVLEDVVISGLRGVRPQIPLSLHVNDGIIYLQIGNVPGQICVVPKIEEAQVLVESPRTLIWSRGAPAPAGYNYFYFRLEDPDFVDDLPAHILARVRKLELDRQRLSPT